MATPHARYQPGGSGVTYQLPVVVPRLDGVTDERAANSYAYDGSGHLTTWSRDALTKVTTYGYDATTGLRTTVTDALGHVSSYATMADRRLTVVTDRKATRPPTPTMPTVTHLTTTDVLGHTSTRSMT